MASAVHPNARTTSQTGCERQEAPPSVSDPEFAWRYDVTRTTVRKWRQRKDVKDRLHRSHTLHSTLTPEQEPHFVQVRVVAPLIVDPAIRNSDRKRVALDRSLRRYRVGNLRALRREHEGGPGEPAHKLFREYVPGFVRGREGTAAGGRTALALDRPRSPALEHAVAAPRGVVKKQLEKAPFRVRIWRRKTRRRLPIALRPMEKREPTGRHSFQRLCAEHGIEHRSVRPNRAQKNAMVERLNGRTANLQRIRHPDLGQHLAETARDCRHLYNQQIRQKALGHPAPAKIFKG